MKPWVRSLLFLALFSLIFLGIGYAAALMIAKRSESSLQDILFCEGLIVLILGAMMSVKGNPSGLSLWSLGRSSQYSAYVNLEVTRMERESTGYFKNFLKHSVVEFAFSNVTIIVSGLLIIAASFLCK